MADTRARQTVLIRCAQDRNQLRGISLPVPVHPRPDEGFSDLVTRAATENGYITRLPILKMLFEEFQYTHWSYLTPLMRRVDPVRATDLLGNSGGKAELIPLLEYPEGQLGQKLFHFFGASLSRWHVRNGRWVSPRALKSDLYLRAMWKIRSLSFDPDTKEMLLGICPQCNASLSDYSTVGLYAPSTPH